MCHERTIITLLRQALGLAERGCGSPGQPLRKAFGFRRQRFRAGNPVHQARRKCCLRVEDIRQQHELDGLAVAHEPGQEIGRSAVGARADLAVRHGEPRPLGRDRKIGRRHDANARAGHGPMDTCEHRLRRALQGQNRLLQIGAALPHQRRRVRQVGMEHRDVPTREKSAACASQHHGARGLVIGCFLAGRAQGADHLHIQGIQDLGPIQRDRCHAFGNRVEDAIAHSRPAMSDE